MRSFGRRKAIAGAMAVALALAVAVSAMPVDSRSTGIDSSAGGVSTGPARGCTCHSPDGGSTPNGNATIFFLISGLSNGYYEPSKAYTINLTFIDEGVPMNANASANKGGFNVWASAGSFDANGSAWVTAYTDGSISHTRQGDVEANRSFTFDWKAPATNATDVTFDILVNAVNGDDAGPADPTRGIAAGLDHWSRKLVVLPGQPGAGAGVDISKLGVPLRAYWLGVIGILSTMFLVLLSFYVIRSGSKFYEFGLPRGQVKAVKIRTIPAPKNKGAYVMLAALMVIAIAIAVVSFSVRDEELDPLQLTFFILGFFGTVALAVFLYIRAFLPIVDVLEEEEIRPLR